MKKLNLVILLLIYDMGGSSTQSLPCHTASGDNCPSSICPNTVVNYTCTIPSGTPAGITDWTLPNGTCPSNFIPNKIRLSQAVILTCPVVANSTCGPYSASNIMPSSDPTNCLSSSLTVNIAAAVDGSTVTCSNTMQSNPSISTVVSSATINVVGPPGAPSVGIANTIGPDMVQVVVNPSSSGGLPTSYNVAISNSSYVYSKTTPAFPNGSAIIIFTGAGLTNNTNYTISSVAINCAGSSNSSDPTTILVSWLAPPPSPSPTSSGSISSTQTPTRSPEPTPIDDPNIGVIIGAVIGGVVFIILLVIAIILLCCCLRCGSQRCVRNGSVTGPKVAQQPLVFSSTKLQNQTMPEQSDHYKGDVRAGFRNNAFSDFENELSETVYSEKSTSEVHTDKVQSSHSAEKGENAVL